MLSNLLATYAIDVAEPVLLWLTVAVVAALLISAVTVYAVMRSKKETAITVIKYLMLGFVFYALVAGIVMLALQLTKYMDYNYLDAKYVSRDIIPFVIVPLLVLFGVILLFSAALVVIYKFKRPLFKPFAIIFAVLVVVGVIVCGITIGTYYFRHIAKDGYYNGNELEGTDVVAKVNQLGLYLSAGGLVVAIIVIAILTDLKNNTRFDSRCIALAGITIALSFALSYVKLFSMPQGGSITLASMLPILLFAYIYGPKKGVFVGLIYGALQAVQDPYIIHPAQFLLDYPVAFASLGLAGVFNKIKQLDRVPQVKFALGAIIAGSFRYLSHLFSGVFAFGAYAIDNEMANFWAYSAAYNSFVFIDIAIVIVVGILILSSKTVVKRISLYPNLKKVAANPNATENTEAAENSEN